MRYYFHLRHDNRLLEDIEGSEFGCMEDVRREAEAGAREIIAERLKAGSALDISTSLRGAG